MLAAETEFPLAGSTAFLRGPGTTVRIVQRLPGDVVIIAEEPRFANSRNRKATGNRRVDLADLRATYREATMPEPRKRGGRRAA